MATAGQLRVCRTRKSQRRGLQVSGTPSQAAADFESAPALARVGLDEPENDAAAGFRLGIRTRGHRLASESWLGLSELANVPRLRAASESPASTGY